MNMVRPEYQRCFYASVGLMAGAISGLFVKSPTIRIVATTALVGAAGSSVYGWLTARDCMAFANSSIEVYREKEFQIFQAKNRVVNGMLRGTWLPSTLANSLIGLAFAGAARVNFSKFSTTVNAKHIALPLIVIQTLAVVLAQLAAWKFAHRVSDNDVRDIEYDLRSKWKACLLRMRTYSHLERGFSVVLIGAIVAQRLGKVKVL